MRPAPGLPLENQSESIIVRICLVDEARGEKDHGGDLDAMPMAAIWWVIRNRANLHHSTPKAEVLKPKQFSGFNVEGGHRAQLLYYWQNDAIAWERADAVCDLCELGLVKDPTNGATHYYNPAHADPPWGRKHPGWQEHVVIRSHAFGIPA